MKIRTKGYGDSQKHEFGDSFVMIKRFPASKGQVRASNDGMVVVDQKQLQNAFVECLTGWGPEFVDEAGQPAKLTDNLKRDLFDEPDPDLAHDGEQLVQFVLRRAKVIAERQEEAEGN